MSHKPESFCTLATENCKDELLGLLLSLAIHHSNASIVCLVDDATRKYIEKCSLSCPINLNIIWHEILNQYKGKNRAQMEQEGTWSEFQMMKTVAIDKALDIFPDTLFLDSDIVICNTIDCIDKSKELGVSPHYIRKHDTDKFGYFNGGVLWTKNKTLPNTWRDATKTSRFYDQASIEDLARSYSYFEFSENYNMSWWRLQQADESPQKMTQYFKLKNHKGSPKVYYKEKALGFIHTHFNRNDEQNFNNFIITLLKQASPTYFRELAIILRISTGKWKIHIPKQPMEYPWNHTNDSFREELILLYKKNVDIELIYDKNKNIYLEPDILLYDRDTINWMEWNKVQAKNIQCAFIGNCTSDDIKFVKSKGLAASPWIYWPRRPIILEKLLADEGLASKTWEERTIQSIFIGNIENAVQGKFRNNPNWSKYLTEYHCTHGTSHKFTQIEYLNKIASAKFGLCLRGYGAKCHREIELMAVGTVPLVTPDVCLDAYMEPLIEGIHCIRVNTPEEIPDILSTINEQRWCELSNACKDWYMRNVHSDNMWRTFMGHFMTISNF
jgi:hypothetical protein